MSTFYLKINHFFVSYHSFSTPSPLSPLFFAHCVQQFLITQYIIDPTKFYNPQLASLFPGSQGIQTALWYTRKLVYIVH